MIRIFACWRSVVLKWKSDYKAYLNCKAHKALQNESSMKLDWVFWQDCHQLNPFSPGPKYRQFFPSKDACKIALIQNVSVYRIPSFWRQVPNKTHLDLQKCVWCVTYSVLFLTQCLVSECFSFFLCLILLWQTKTIHLFYSALEEETQQYCKQF